MFSSAEHQLLYKVANAQVFNYPYPHIYINDVFPADFYQGLRQHLPRREALKSLVSTGRVGKDYSEARWVFPVTLEGVETLSAPYRNFWHTLGTWMLSGRFTRLALSKFAPYIMEQFEDPQSLEYHHEILVVQDETSYSLGPHTDSPQKVLSFLFYLPPDDSQQHLGTSMYVPRDPSFKCPGGPHYGFDRFERVMTMPYVPNALFGFLKTDHSFHGVEAIKEQNVKRDLMLFDIRATARIPMPPPATPELNVKFSF
jgi:hypothetical protein